MSTYANMQQPQDPPTQQARQATRQSCKGLLPVQECHTVNPERPGVVAPLDTYAQLQSVAMHDSGTYCHQYMIVVLDASTVPAMAKGSGS